MRTATDLRGHRRRAHPGGDGTPTVKGTTLEAATTTANLSGVTSDESRRDGAIQRALDTSRFPTATFVLTEPVDVGSGPAEGQGITAAATGDLTILVVVGSTGRLLRRLRGHGTDCAHRRQRRRSWRRRGPAVLHQELTTERTIR